MYSTMPTIFENYKVSVEICPIETIEGFTSVLHVGKGRNEAVAGDRNPAIFFYGNRGSTEMRIGTYANGNLNYAVRNLIIPMKQWSTVVIQQEKEKFLFS